MTIVFPSNFIKITLITSIWVNLSEVFRYFIIVMPTMRRDLAEIPDVAPMDLLVFSIWGIWDTVLTASIVFITWLCNHVYVENTRSILVSGMVCWVMFFLLFWIGMVNMNLASPELLLFTLPLSMLETFVAAWIALKLIKKYNA